jgi:hypothetical protein
MGETLARVFRYDAWRTHAKRQGRTSIQYVHGPSLFKKHTMFETKLHGMVQAEVGLLLVIHAATHRHEHAQIHLTPSSVFYHIMFDCHVCCY